MNPTGDFPESEPTPPEEIAFPGSGDGSGPALAPGELSFSAQVLQSFSGRIDPPRFSLLYQFSLLLVTAFMLLLPVLYVALIGAMAWSVCWYARHAVVLFGGPFGSIYLYILRLVLYLGPLFAGTVAVFFMFKPLFAGRAGRVQPLTINPGAEPVLFAFICKVCELVRAPVPSQIALASDVGASAGFRGLFSGDFVLTIGMPLVAGLTLNQFAGVLAHEFGHFTQGMGMRLTYVIEVINRWFGRVVFGRDTWDQLLEEATEGSDSFLWHFIVGMARLAVWFSRLILHGLMYAGHFVSSYASRQMEYGADEFEMQVAGSATFETTMLRLPALSGAEQASRHLMQKMWEKNQRLPDDFAAFVQKLDASLPPESRTEIEDRAGLRPTRWYDSHPSMADRIRRARQLAAPGVFHLEWPSTSLFQNFEALSRQVTLVHYREEVGVPILESNLVPVHAPEKPAEPEPAPEETAAAPEPDGKRPRIRLRIPRR